ncbi:prepilin peptidase [Methanopyrus sp. SNP6]|uniref:prepilin peptidase n=1 Tax=Methanopyrus sp. SNP6 TaxID=1937005 RepID=UPI0011E5FF69|nr:prepilin peptidase [Methanopyrus sp. SNP6]
MDTGFLAGLIVASTAAITDLRWGIVPNLLTYPAVVAGVVYTAVVDPSHFGYALLDSVVAFVVAFVLNALGVIGGGDVKLMPSLALFIHQGDRFTTGIDILFNSVLLYAPFALLYLTVRTAMERGRPFLEELCLNTTILALVSSIAGGLSTVLGTAISSLIGALLILAVWWIKSRWLEPKVIIPVLAVPAILLNLGTSSIVILWEVGVAVILSTAFTAYRWAGEERNVEELREGEIPLEIVVRTEDGVKRVGRMKGALLVAIGRAEPAVVPSGDGFTSEELEKLKRLGIHEIRVGHTTPFAPAIAAGYVVTYTLKGSPLSWLWG